MPMREDPRHGLLVALVVALVGVLLLIFAALTVAPALVIVLGLMTYVVWWYVSREDTSYMHHAQEHENRFWTTVAFCFSGALVFVHDSPVAVGQWSPILGFIVVMMFTFSVHSYDRQLHRSRIGRDPMFRSSVESSEMLHTTVQDKCRRISVCLSKLDNRLVATNLNHMLWADMVQNLEKEIVTILSDAEPAELNYMLPKVGLGLLFYKVKDHFPLNLHRTRLLDLLAVTRISELNVTSRALVLDGLQQMRLSAHRKSELYAKNVILKTKGDDLSELKSLTDAKGDIHSIHKLVYRDIKDASIREEVLKHIATQAKVQAAHMRLKTRTGHRRSDKAWRKILSDVDDTLTSSGGHFPAGVDRRYPRKSVYPGVLDFYREMDLGANGPSEWPVGQLGNLVFLSARPHVYKDMSESKSYAKFKKLQDEKRLYTSPTLLAGSIDTGKTMLLTGNMEPVAEKKFQNFAEYVSLYPEFTHVFVGDNGQGDVRAAEMMAEQYPGSLEAVYMQRVVPEEKTFGYRGPETRLQWKKANIFFFGDYVEAACHAYRHGLIQAVGLQRVCQGAVEQFVDMKFEGPLERELQRRQINQSVWKANKLLQAAYLEPNWLIRAVRAFDNLEAVLTPFGRGTVINFRPEDGVYEVLLDWSQKASGPIAARGNVNVPKPATAPVTPVHGRANASVGTSASVAAVTPTARRRASATAAVASSTPANSSGETGLPMAPPPPPAVAPRTPTADTLPPAILPPPGSSTSLEASSVAVAPVLGEDDGIPEPDAGGEADADADAAGTQRPVSLPTSTMVTTPHCGPDAAGGGEGVQDAQGAMRPRSEQQQQQQQQHHEQSFVAAAAEAAATAASTTVENLAAVAMVGAAASDHAADMISAVMTTNAGEEAAGGPMPPLSPTAAAAAAAALIESAPGGMAGMFDDDIRDDGGDGGVTVGGVPVTQASPLSKAELEEREAANAALRKAAEEAVDRRGPRDDRRHDRPGLLGELVRPQSAGAGYGGTGWDTALEPCEEEEYKSEAGDDVSSDLDKPAEAKPHMEESVAATGAKVLAATKPGSMAVRAYLQLPSLKKAPPEPTKKVDSDEPKSSRLSARLSIFRGGQDSGAAAARSSAKLSIAKGTVVQTFMGLAIIRNVRTEDGMCEVSFQQWTMSSGKPAFAVLRTADLVIDVAATAATVGKSPSLLGRTGKAISSLFKLTGDTGGSVVAATAAAAAMTKPDVIVTPPEPQVGDIVETIFGPAAVTAVRHHSAPRNSSPAPPLPLPVPPTIAATAATPATITAVPVKTVREDVRGTRSDESARSGEEQRLEEDDRAGSSSSGRQATVTDVANNDHAGGADIKAGGASRAETETKPATPVQAAARQTALEEAIFGSGGKGQVKEGKSSSSQAPRRSTVGGEMPWASPGSEDVVEGKEQPLFSRGWQTHSSSRRRPRSASLAGASSHTSSPFSNITEGEGQLGAQISSRGAGVLLPGRLFGSVSVGSSAATPKRTRGYPPPSPATPTASVIGSGGGLVLSPIFSRDSGEIEDIGTDGDDGATSSPLGLHSIRGRRDSGASGGRASRTNTVMYEVAFMKWRLTGNVPVRAVLNRSSIWAEWEKQNMRPQPESTTRKKQASRQSSFFGFMSRVGGLGSGGGASQQPSPAGSPRRAAKGSTKPSPAPVHVCLFAPGVCVKTMRFGPALVTKFRAEDGIYEVSLLTWKLRRGGPTPAYLNRSAIESAVAIPGAAVRTFMGVGIVQDVREDGVVVVVTAGGDAGGTGKGSRSSNDGAGRPRGTTIYLQLSAILGSAKAVGGERVDTPMGTGVIVAYSNRTDTYMIDLGWGLLHSPHGIAVLERRVTTASNPVGNRMSGGIIKLFRWPLFGGGTTARLPPVI